MIAHSENVISFGAVSEDEPTLSFAQRKQQALHEEIIDAAFAEFAQRGYHDTGIADIARRLGIGHGTFYRYFQNKRDILDHVVTQLIERLLDALTEDNAPDAATTLESYQQQTQRIAVAVTEIFQDDPRAAQILLFEATSIDEQLTDRLLSVLDTAASLTAGYFENGIRHGYIRADLDTVASAEAVVGMMIAAILNILRHPENPDRHQRFSAALLRLMLDGILVPPASNPGETPNIRSAPA
jgi:AcrR family transcriptional regulator